MAKQSRMKGHRAMTYQRKISESQVHLINTDGTRLEQLLLADLAACEAALAEKDMEVERLKAELALRQCVDCGEPILVH